MDKKKELTPWINGFRDTVPRFNVCENSLILSELMGDGDTRLVIADLSNRLISYKGVNIDWESNLNDTPIAIQSFLDRGGSIPTLAVSIDSQVYLYRSSKAILKLQVPPIKMQEQELQIWENYNLDANIFKQFIEDLNQLKNKDIQLTNITLNVLSLQSTRKQYDLVKQIKDGQLEELDTCICMGNISIHSEGTETESQLILGTELKKLHIADDKGFSIEKTYNLPGTPIQIRTKGTLKDDYQIFVALRENKIVIIQNGQLLQKSIDINSKICQFIKVQDFLYVGQMDDSVCSYGLQGVKNFSLKMNDHICALEAMEYSRSKFSGYLVALENQEIRIYKEKLLVYTLKSDGIVQSMKFGKFGREDGTLVLIYKDKGLDVKFLIRQFNFQHYITQAQQKQNEGINEAEIQPLNLPKKTKLFLENSIRERENPVPIHKTFQKDLMKLRLSTAKQYLSIIEDGNIQNILSNESNLRLQASVEGIGPIFKIQFNIENLGADPLTELYIIYSYDSKILKIQNPVFEVPFLLPNISYPVSIMVENIDQNGSGDILKILICQRKISKPLIGAIVQMPLSELRN